MSKKGFPPHVVTKALIQEAERNTVREKADKAKQLAAKREREEAEKRAWADWCVSKGLPRPVWEHQFHPTRKWRFDFVFMNEKVAVEKDGISQRGENGRAKFVKSEDGKWIPIAGAHLRPEGRIKDLEKEHAAIMLGWRYMRMQANQMRSDYFLAVLRCVLLGIEPPKDLKIPELYKPRKKK